MTTMSNSVRTYLSTHTEAPQIVAAAGNLIAVLDACLVDGYNPKTVNTLVVLDGIVTATISSGNPFEPGAVLRISGASPGTLNGDWRIGTADATTVTWSVEGLGIADVSATGTITAMRAPAGWEKLFSGTNRAAYRSLSHATHSGMILYVDDTSATVARARGYESMTDLDTGTGPFPTDAMISGGFYWGKAGNAGVTTARKWAVVADDKRVTFSCAFSEIYPGAVACSFGRLALTAEDEYASAITGANTSENAISPDFGNGAGQGLIVRGVTVLSPVECAVVRADSALAGAVACTGSTAGGGQSGGTSYATAEFTDDIYVEPARIFQGSSSLYRGTLPGPSHVYRNLPIAEAPNFTLIGEPGNGLLVLRYGGTSGPKSWALDLGNNGRWE